jgi:hypothetical protein
MNGRGWLRLCVAAVACVLGSVLLSGCFEADKTILARYDAASDEFSVLVVYQRIRSVEKDGKVETDADLAHLAALYANRDHLIFFPYGTPFPLEGLGESAILRVDGKTAYGVSLGIAAKPGDDPQQPEATPIPLDGVKITPGALFVREPGNLCYYHQMTFPGKMLDAALEQMRQGGDYEKAIETLDKTIADRKAGGKKATWAEMRAALIKDMERDIAKDLEGKDVADEPVVVPLAMETESLVMLRDLLKEKKLGFTRQGSVLSAKVALAGNDAQELATTAEEVRKAALARLKAATPKDSEAGRYVVWGQKLAALPAVSAAGNTVELRFDVVKAIETFTQPTEKLPERSPQQLEKAAATEKLAAGKMEVRNDVKLEQIVADFKAGKLVGNPSKPPVAPGTGLVKK